MRAVCRQGLLLLSSALDSAFRRRALPRRRATGGDNLATSSALFAVYNRGVIDERRLRPCRDRENPSARRPAPRRAPPPRGRRCGRPRGPRSAPAERPERPTTAEASPGPCAPSPAPGRRASPARWPRRATRRPAQRRRRGRPPRAQRRDEAVQLERAAPTPIAPHRCTPARRARVTLDAELKEARARQPGRPPTATPPRAPPSHRPPPAASPGTAARSNDELDARKRRFRSPAPRRAPPRPGRAPPGKKHGRDHAPTTSSRRSSRRWQTHIPSPRLRRSL